MLVCQIKGYAMKYFRNILIMFLNIYQVFFSYVFYNELLAPFLHLNKLEIIFLFQDIKYIKYKTGH